MTVRLRMRTKTSMEEIPEILISATQFLGHMENNAAVITALSKGEHKCVLESLTIERKERLVLLEPINDFLHPGLNSGYSMAYHRLCNVVLKCVMYARRRYRSVSFDLMGEAEPTDSQRKR